MQQLIEASRIQINFAIVKGVCTKGAYILDKNKLSKYENLDSIVKSKLDENLNPPPVKKSKLEYEEDPENDSETNENECDNPLDVKFKLFCSKIGAFSNNSINIDNHLHPPRSRENKIQGVWLNLE